LAIQTVTGLGGVGKTQLVARYVASHADSYEIVAWVRAQDGGVGDLAALARVLGLEVGESPPEERAALVLGELERTQRRWLLVLDNLAGPRQLEQCCPPGGHGRVIVTTRHRGFDQFGPVLAVDVFDEDEATDYLVRWTKRPDETAAARRLAIALGGLPLALSHAAAFCVESGTTFEDYLHLLSGLPTNEIFAQSPEAFYEQTVASTWEPSIEAAKAEAALAPTVLRMAAHLAPGRIPRSLFGVLVADPSQPRYQKALVDAFATLHRYSLADADQDTLSVHRVLQKVVRDDVGADPQPALAAIAALEMAWPADVALTATWRECEHLLPHVLALGATQGLTGERALTVVRVLSRGCASTSFVPAAASGRCRRRS
jgi:hypothetical protein